MIDDDFYNKINLVMRLVIIKYFTYKGYKKEVLKYL